MRITSFVASGIETYGLVEGKDGLIDLGARSAGRYRTLRDLIASGGLEAVAQDATGAGVDYHFADVRFLPPIPHPYNILSTGGNFACHIQEMVEGGLSKGAPPLPGFHIKTPGSLVGHLNPLIKPNASDQFDWENEFAIIIGKPGRHIPLKKAFDYVLGYSVFNDGSMRDYQLQQSVSAGKNFSQSSSFGPWISTKDEVGDINDIFLTTRLNGDVVQHAQVGTCVFPVDLLISYLSEIIHLQPGDVLTTGTCAGVGFFRKPPLYLKVGDTLEIEAEGIGAMKHLIVAEG